MRRNGQNSTSDHIFNPKFETAMGCLLFDYEFWWRLLQDLCVFWAKTAFVMQNFWNLGAGGGGVTILWRNLQKAHPWLISRVMSHYVCRFVHAFFFARRLDEKGTLQKVKERLYFTCLWGIAHWAKFYYMSRGRRRNQAYQVW